ncbi:TetR/AcrR family transcriptional regulator [Actinocorallia sp. A-T 12471]|uniref:TetR/AcrR family transcriptional regulator n=1 Tax=Actinocorallia sp. A-T 12471 TaxID=3089813 RepID=UPI0029CE362A|nr:TetR/AcrR family transcriptional regulator [Actinocorallia sp. A-T 12471]MDX6742468.1 TetR/AcrR family transcriptional regulator [Actinocorallia sp. A-T 12471]
MTSQHRTRPYRGVPAEERRAQRRAALMEAGLELLGTRGWAATTVRGVCSLAGLNDRYFYENFADRDTLLLAIVDEQAALGTARILEAAEDVTAHLPELARASVTATVDFLTSDPRLAHVLGHEFPANPLLQQRRGEIIENLATLFAKRTRYLLGETPLSDTDLALTSFTLTSGLWDLIAAWLRGDVPIDRDHLIDYTVALLLTVTDLAAPLHKRLT